MIRKAYNPREAAEEKRRDLKARAAAFAMAAQEVANDPATPQSERQFLVRLAGNAWKVSDWPSSTR